MVPPPPKTSPITGEPVHPSYIHASSIHFRDTHGRSLLLRGVNLSGGAKQPNGQPSWSRDGFWEEAEAGRGDFINRTLNLDDGSADVHLARLRAWGFNTLRWVFTWEAIEHEGPGKYDDDYLDYVVRALQKCKEWGFKVFMDPHQDVWSRFSGGDGAPIWTLYACGIDPRHSSETWGALVHSQWPTAEDPKPATFPAMIWGTNYTRLVSQTIFTFFFAGRAYAPKCIIDGKNIQDWLQEHYFGAVIALAKKIAAQPGLYDECVIGWDSFNEPGEGLIGHPDITAMNPALQLKKGPMPTPLEGMRMGMGQAVEVDDWYFGPLGPTKSKKVRIDPQGVRLWLDDEGERERGGGKWGWKRDPGWKLGSCVWALHGIWDPKTNAALKPTYFATLASDPSKKADFVPDFWGPHFVDYITRIRKVHRDAICFVEPPVFHKPPRLPETILAGRACYAPHFYDGLTLMTKHWNWFNADALGLIRGKYWTVLQAVKVGDAAIKQMLQDALSVFLQDTKECMGEYPTLLGEIGCPYDMDDKKAYGYVDGGRGEGDYTMQRRAWDASLNAADGKNALNFTVWTYVPDNSHEYGDLWNGEDLSLWSADDLEKPSEIESAPATTAASPVDSSAASSTTLIGSALNKFTSFSPDQISSGSFSASLILDGARAIDAICRPFAIAIVGQPIRADFNFYTSEYKLSVRVGADDKVPQGVATEVYLPFIHYAADLTFSPTSASGSRTRARSLLSTRSANTSRASLLQGEKSRSATPTPSMTPTPDTPLRINADIHVSAGTYEITGQTLKWFYPLPTHGETSYTLTVKRKGGPIKRAQGYGSAGGTGSWADVVQLVRSLGL